MDESKAEWRLYYWPKMLGRGEFMRLLFAETSTSYEDVYKLRSWQEVAQENYASGKVFFAVPAIQHGSFFLSQTPAVVRYIAKKCDGGRLYPQTEEDDFYAQSLMAGVVDVVAEGHDAWHAIDKNASYASQAKECVPFITYFTTKRLPRWLDFFETALRRNGTSSSEGFFVGRSLTYVDIGVFHWLHGVHFQLPEVFNAANIPLLKRRGA